MTVIGWLTALVVWSLVSAAVLLASLLLTSPLGIGPVGVTVWFVILFTCLGAVLTLVLYGAKTFLRLHLTGVSRLRYSMRQSLLLSAWLAGMLALSSLQQLGPLDVILLGLLLLIVEVYVRLRWP